MRRGLILFLALWANGWAVASAQSAPADEQFFSEKVFPVLERAGCRLCHNDNGIATGTKLQFPSGEASEAEVAAFGWGLAALVDRAAPEQSLLWRKPTQRMPHTGGERIPQGSPEEAVLKRWVEMLARLDRADIQARSKALPPAAERAADDVVRRLTHSQYNNTVRDLLGDQTRPADHFPTEDFVHGFTNQAEAQSISPLLAEAYNAAAQKLARVAFRGGDNAGAIPCEPRGPADIECRDRFLKEFGRRAFRRPLREREAEAYAELFERAARDGQSFLAGAQLVVEAMLQSPNFLFYGQQGSASHRAASRLSYFLWNTMPDEHLLRAADSGLLQSREQIEAAARRMLDHPRARQSMDEFLAQWLRFDRVHKAFRDIKTYPEYSAELLHSMTEETRRFFHHLVWGDKDFRDFFRARYSFIDRRLAKLYGLPEPKRGFERVEFPPQSERAGVLGQASFLTVTGKPGDSSPTERGLFIREHFLCQVVPPPPPGVNTTLPPVTDEKPMSNRQRLFTHLSNEACAGCHRLVDPIGFGFERFDALGRYRLKQEIVIQPTADERRTKRKTEPTTYHLDIDPSAYIQGLPDSEFSSPREAGEILANDPVCQRCVVKQLFRYALGRHETPADQDAIDRALQRFQGSQFRVRELIIAIATSGPFLGGPS